MKDNLTKEELEIKERCEKARAIVGQLCSRGRYPKMSIPLREDDEDQVLIKALSESEGLLNTISLLREEKEKWKAAFAQAVSVTGLKKQTVGDASAGFEPGLVCEKRELWAGHAWGAYYALDEIKSPTPIAQTGEAVGEVE
jgi:hypothetical protein